VALCRGSSCGDVPFCGSRGEAIAFRFRPSPCGNKDAYPGAYRRRFDRLMAQVADRASIGGRVGVMMPDLSERHPHHYREKRYRE
jgi:hypothetical protein